jgi:DNA-binding response OmpR family regulator
MIKILVVDDDHDIVPLFEQMFRRELERKDFSFIFKFSMDDALGYIRDTISTDLVLVLSDINMPGRSGLDLLKELKERAISIPIFLFTAYDEANNRILAEQFKVDKYLVKPIDFASLKRDIYALIEKHNKV